MSESRQRTRVDDAAETSGSVFRFREYPPQKVAGQTCFPTRLALGLSLFQELQYTVWPTYKNISPW